MDTHNICLYKSVEKKYTGCNLKTTELVDSALIGVCAVIRSNAVVGLYITRYIVSGNTFRTRRDIMSSQEYIR